MAKIELDWAVEKNPLAHARRRAKKHGLTLEVARAVGPGGWPTYRFAGTREAICDLIEGYAGDEEEVSYLATTIEE